MRGWLMFLFGVCLLLSATQCAECALDDASEHADPDDCAPALRIALGPAAGLELEAPQPARLAASAPAAYRIPRPPIA